MQRRTRNRSWTDGDAVEVVEVNQGLDRLMDYLGILPTGNNGIMNNVMMHIVVEDFGCSKNGESGISDAFK